MSIGRKVGLVLLVTLMAAMAIRATSVGPMVDNVDRFAVAVDSPPDRIEIYRSGLREKPRVLKTGFLLKWVSRDGLWVGGLTFRSVFDRGPLCLYVQNVRTSERLDYCGILREVERFAFTDDFRYLAVLGKPLDQANEQEPKGLFLLDLADSTRGPIYVMRGLDRLYISGVSFTYDGHHLTFARGDELFSYDLRDRNLKSLGRGTEPILAPSGLALCYVDSADRVVVQDMRTGNRKFLGEVGTGSPQWSPDGLRILFLRPYSDDDGNNFELVSIAPTTQKVEVLGQIYSLGGQYWWVAR